MSDIAESIGAAEAPSAGEEERTFSEQVLDELLPEDLDWEDVVRTYPLVCLGVAGVAGYLLGRRSGRALVVAATDSAVSRMQSVASELIGADVD